MWRSCAWLALAALAGCASVPDGESEQPIPAGKLVAPAIALCTTRVDELTEKLGAPSRDGRLGRARVMTWIVEWEPLVKYLGIMANDAGTVVDLYWDLPTEVPWTPTDRCG